LKVDERLPAPVLSDGIRKVCQKVVSNLLVIWVYGTRVNLDQTSSNQSG
jgi:hypothetical protein